MNIENGIREIVAEILQIPAEELDTSASSSLTNTAWILCGRWEILAKVENRYNITIDPDNLAKMTCIDEVIHLTEDCLSKT